MCESARAHCRCGLVLVLYILGNIFFGNSFESTFNIIDNIVYVVPGE